MSLRLAGEEFSVVRGLDALSWPRQVEANDADPGLKITQGGSGLGLQVVSGNLGIGANKVIFTNGLLKETASDSLGVRNAADNTAFDFSIKNLHSVGNIYLNTNAARIDAPNDDAAYARLMARDTGVGQTEVARLQGQAEPRFKFALPAQLYTKADTGDPTGVEGDLYVNLFDNALRLYADAAWHTVISW